MVKRKLKYVVIKEDIGIVLILEILYIIQKKSWKL